MAFTHRLAVKVGAGNRYATARDASFHAGTSADLCYARADELNPQTDAGSGNRSAFP